MTFFIGKPSKYWYAYTLDRKKLLGKAVKLKNLVDKLGTKNVVYSKSRLAI